MTARLVMNANPAVLRDTDKISLAAEQIMQHRCRRLPVVDKDGKYVGVFGINCLLRLVLPRALVMEGGLDNAAFLKQDLKDLHQRFIRHMEDPITICMKEDVRVISPDTPLIETLRILYNHKGSLPVVEPKSGKFCGVVTYWDVGAAILAAEV